MVDHIDSLVAKKIKIGGTIQMDVFCLKIESNAEQ